MRDQWIRAGEIMQISGKKMTKDIFTVFHTIMLLNKSNDARVISDNSRTISDEFIHYFGAGM